MKIIYEDTGIYPLPPDSEAMRITNQGDKPVEGYIIHHGIEKRAGRAPLDFFTVKYYFEQVDHT